MSTPGLEIGWAQVDITPTGPVSLWGQMHRRVSQRVRDPLTATALAVRGDRAAGGSRRFGEPGWLDHAVIVSCDLCAIDERILAELRRRVARSLPELAPEAIVLCATHTHTGPYTAEDQSFIHFFGAYALPNPLTEDRADPPGLQTPESYAGLLVESLESVVLRAWRALGPGSVGLALGHAVVGHNRRMVYADGSAEMYGSTNRPDFARPEAGSDHGVEILYTRSGRGSAGELSGVVVNVACPSQIVEGERYVSADYWGSVREELRRRLGVDLMVLPLCGAAGDQSPRDLVRRNRGEPDMYDEPGLGEVGRRIADAVEGALPGARPIETFGHLVRTLDLPRRTVSDAEAAGARETYQSLRARIGPDRPLTGEDMFELFPPIGVMLRHEAQETRRTCPTEVHAIRLGAAAIVTNPFELYQEFGLRMKARSRAEQTFVAQLACGNGGYLPTEAAVAGGGYGAVVASGEVGPEGGTLLVERSLDLVDLLFPGGESCG